MTSSLVGSEMCIRDRPCAPPPPTGTEPIKKIEGKKKSALMHKAYPGNQAPCLLYTSDAADDM
eukprot:11328057-Prorocentrum_lima.AAC.1